MGASRRGAGEGSFEKLPSGRWRCVVSRQIDGRQVKNSRSFDTKREAQAWRDSLRGEVVRAGTLGDWLTSWLILIRPDVAPKTYRHDSQKVERWIRPHLGAVKFRDLTPLTIRSWLADLSTLHHASDSERQKAGAVLRKCLNSAVTHAQIPKSPMAGVKLPNPKRPEKRSLTPAELLGFFEAAGPHAYAYRLWADAGLRPGEFFALQWSDISSLGVVTVERSLDADNHRLKATKTRKGRRRIDLSPSTVAALLVARPAGGGVFCPDTRGGMWWESNFLEERFRPVAQAAGVPWATPYTLRHTCATLLLRAGVPVKVVSERLGHEDITTTLRTYAHVMEGDQGRAASVWEQILASHAHPTPPDCTPDQKTQAPD